MFRRIPEKRRKTAAGYSIIAQIEFRISTISPPWKIYEKEGDFIFIKETNSMEQMVDIILNKLPKMRKI